MPLLSEESRQTIVRCNDCFVDRLSVAGDHDMRQEMREHVQCVLLHYFVQIDEFVCNHRVENQEMCDKYVTSTVTSLYEALTTPFKHIEGQTVDISSYYYYHQEEIIISELCNKLIGSTKVLSSTTPAETNPLYIMLCKKATLLSNCKDNSKPENYRECIGSNLLESNVYFYLQPEVYIKWSIALEVIHKGVLASNQRQDDDLQIEFAYHIATVDLFVAMIYTLHMRLQQKEKENNLSSQLSHEHTCDVIQPHVDMYVQHLAWVLTLLTQFMSGEWCLFEEKIVTYNNNMLMTNKNAIVDSEIANIDCEFTRKTIISALVAGKKLFSFLLVHHVILPFAHVISKRMYSAIYKEEIDCVHEYEKYSKSAMKDMELHICQATFTELKEWSMTHFNFDFVSDIAAHTNANKSNNNSEMYKDRSNSRWLANEVVRQIMHEALMQLTQILIEHADDFLAEMDDVYDVKLNTQTTSSRTMESHNSGWSDDDDDDYSSNDDVVVIDTSGSNSNNNRIFDQHNDAKCETSVRSAKTRLRSLLCMLSNNFGEVFMQQELLIRTLQRLCA